jgi:hypothetical protein
MTSGDVITAAAGPVAPETVAISAPELPAPTADNELQEKTDVVAAATGPVAPQTPEEVAVPETTGRTG